MQFPGGILRRGDDEGVTKASSVHDADQMTSTFE